MSAESAEHLEVLVEEPSMEAFLRALLPKLIGDRATFNVYPYQGKDDLLGKLRSRLQGYVGWLPENWRIVVLLDRDESDCNALKERIERDAESVGLRSRSRTDALPWQIVNRIAIEELEAWYFGDWTAVKQTYPRVAATVPIRAAYRSPDAIQGGTWEALQRILQRAGYFKSGLRKIEIARAIGRHANANLNRSPSFLTFKEALLEAVV